MYLYTNDFEEQMIEVSLKTLPLGDGDDPDFLLLDAHSHGYPDWIEVVLDRDQALALGKALIERFSK
jgi:hypothetical protein